MEMGSGSTNSNTSPPPCEPESIVDGLKFGKKIYFEDVGSGGAQGKSGPGGSSAGAGRKVQGGQQQPPRCQVEGCNVDLSDAKAYYSRHKVCGMHSKSPKVVVNGLEQRFCQQCSRFHLLPEFDQGKRSCRRRLAGHNERRRKPPPGSGLSSRYGRLCSTMSENGRGGFLMDFSAYPRNAARDPWSRSYSAGNCTTGSARSTPNPYNSRNPPSILHLQGSSSGTGFPSSGIPPGECYTFPNSGIPPGECFTGVGVNDSSCALSLLSNQQWGSRNRASGLCMNDQVNAGDAPTVQSTSHGVNPYPNSLWGIKNEGGGSSHEMRPDLGLGQIPQPLNLQFSSELELSHPQNRQYMDLEQQRGYDSSSTHINWSL